MPFKSVKQEKYLWSQEPEVARRFADETKKGKETTPLQRAARERLKKEGE